LVGDSDEGRHAAGFHVGDGHRVIVEKVGRQAFTPPGQQRAVDDRDGFALKAIAADHLHDARLHDWRVRAELVGER
jgi:hypothetical protein